MPPVTVPLDVQPDALDAAAAALARIAGEVRDAGTRLEHATLSPPRVGDLPATAVFDQAHYDWTQTRFEDRIGSTGSKITDDFYDFPLHDQPYPTVDSSGRLTIPTADRVG